MSPVSTPLAAPHEDRHIASAEADKVGYVGLSENVGLIFPMK